jgi:hypothetical protein
MVDSRKFFGTTYLALKDPADGPRQAVIATVDPGKRRITSARYFLASPIVAKCWDSL